MFTLPIEQMSADPQPTPQYPQPPAQQLAELRDILLHTFRTEFDAAAEKKDQAGVSRFFRLWPGIGAEKEGLEAYGDFVVGLVKARGSSATKRESIICHLIPFAYSQRRHQFTT
jgi:hypothetical protein